MSFINHSFSNISDYFYIFAEKSHDVLWVRSPDYSQQLYISPIYEKIWGRPCEELYKYPERWTSFLHPDDVERLAVSISQRNHKVSETDIFIEKYRVVRPDGTIRWIEDKSFPLFKNGNLIAFAGIAQDITTQVMAMEQIQRAKEIAEAADLKNNFIQNMQHDMRTPTTGLFHLFDLIVEAKSKEELKKLLTLGKSSAKELLVLCDKVVDFENIEQKNQTVLLKKLSIKDVVERVQALNSAAAKNKNIAFSVEIAEGIPDLVRGDEYRLQKILTNLVGNSIKFTESGEIKITIKLNSVKGSKLVIEFGVHDTGIGIPEDKRELIFEKFIRLNPSNQGVYKGSGLGLSIVKKCVEELEGEIDVESELGKRTSFYVTLPFLKSLSTRKLKRNYVTDVDLNNKESITEVNNVLNFDITHDISHDYISESKFGIKNTLKVLLIEDQKAALFAAKAMLEHAGCLVTTAENVVEAKQQLDNHLFELIISDIGLPDGSGFDISQYVKSTKNHLNKNTPFVALTAHMDKSIKTKAEALGFDHVFHKPITPQRVQTIIDIYSVEPEKELPKELILSSEPIIDFELSKQLMGGDEKVAQEVLEVLIRTAPPDIVALEASIMNKNSKKAREVLHKIKGGLMYCSVPRFKQAIEHLHIQVKSTEDFSAWQKAFNTLQEEWGKLVAAYHELFK